MYLKRFYLRHSFVTYEGFKIMLTCIYLAGKIEESYIGAEEFCSHVQQVGVGCGCGLGSHFLASTWLGRSRSRTLGPRSSAAMCIKWVWSVGSHVHHVGEGRYS